MEVKYIPKLKLNNMDNIAFDTNTNKLTIDVKPIVKVKNTISIVGSDHELPVEVTADFTNIPSHLHESYLMALQGKYVGDTKIWVMTDTETPEPKTIKKQKKNRIIDLMFGKFK